MKATISLLIALLLAVSLMACKKEQEAAAPAPVEQTAPATPAEQGQASAEQQQASTEQGQASAEQQQASTEQGQASASPAEQK